MNEIARRRTLAIISHPDAGKTTLTEKLLLYGGAVQLAGSVTARKNQRATTSDWMELERQRGISVSSTVLQFEYRDCVINLLDTPGHRDFSEDTYRVLMAVDAVIMVIDAAKGIESQTLKLFEICRMRGIPIYTFMNKLDRPAKDPLSLLDELENTLQLRVFARNWPLGDGPEFRGVYDRQERLAHFFERTVGGAYRAPEALHAITDEAVCARMTATTHAGVVEALEMLDAAGETYDPEAIRSGDMTPIYFGSAIHNFGVQLLLDDFIASAPAPSPRKTLSGNWLPPEHPAFSGFIFKIQSNMDPHHRDQIAFLRVCTGVFQRDMKVIHPRSGKIIRMSHSRKFFARERETVNEAWPGDVIGLVGHPEFRIGDTLTEEPGIEYEPMPQFAPECFAWLEHTTPAQYKRFREGLDQLLQEGAVQAFSQPESARRVPLLGAVGPLQFEVMQYRIENEYGAQSRLSPAPWRLIRWVDSIGEPVNPEDLPSGGTCALDALGRQVLLFGADWEVGFYSEKHPKVILRRLPSELTAPAAE